MPPPPHAIGSLADLDFDKSGPAFPSLLDLHVWNLDLNNTDDHYKLINIQQYSPALQNLEIQFSSCRGIEDSLPSLARVAAVLRGQLEILWPGNAGFHNVPMLIRQRYSDDSELRMSAVYYRETPYCAAMLKLDVSPHANSHADWPARPPHPRQTFWLGDSSFGLPMTPSDAALRLREVVSIPAVGRRIRTLHISNVLLLAMEGTLHCAALREVRVTFACDDVDRRSKGAKLVCPQLERVSLGRADDTSTVVHLWNFLTFVHILSLTRHNEGDKRPARKSMRFTAIDVMLEVGDKILLWYFTEVQVVDTLAGRSRLLAVGSDWEHM